MLSDKVYSSKRRNDAADVPHTPSQNQPEKSPQSDFARSRDKKRKPIFKRSDSSYSKGSTPRKRNVCNEGRWTEKQHDCFMEGYEMFGKDWAEIARIVKTRTSAQVRSHAQKYFYRVDKDDAQKVDLELLSQGRSLRKRPEKSKNFRIESEMFSRAPRTPCPKEKARKSEEKEPLSQFKAAKKETKKQKEKKKKRQNQPAQRQKKESSPKLEVVSQDRRLQIPEPIPHPNNYPNDQQRYPYGLTSGIPGQVMLPLNYFFDRIYPLLLHREGSLSGVLDEEIRRSSEENSRNWQRTMPIILENTMRNENSERGVMDETRFPRYEGKYPPHPRNFILESPNIEEPLLEKIEPEESDRRIEEERVDFEFSSRRSAFKPCEK